MSAQGKGGVRVKRAPKNALWKAAFALAAFFLFLCADQALYYKSPWGGGGFLDVEPFVITVSLCAFVLLFIVSLVLLYLRNKRAETPIGCGDAAKSALPLLTGAAAACGLLRFLWFPGSATFHYLTGFYAELTPSTFLGLTVKQHFILHCALTAVLLLLTVLLFLKQRKRIYHR